MSAVPAIPAFDDAAVDLARLPGRIRGLVRRLGVMRTIEFLERFGGTKLRVRALHQSGRLTPSLNYRDVVDYLGQDGVDALLAAYPEHLEILLPMPDKILQQLRLEQIATAIASGVPTRTIAMHCRLTQRSVQLIKRRIEAGELPGRALLPACSRQQDLFS